MSATLVQDYKLLNSVEYAREIADFFRTLNYAIIKDKRDEDKLYLIQNVNNSLDISNIKKTDNKTTSKIIYLSYQYNIDELIEKFKRKHKEVNNILIEDLETCSVKMSAEDISLIKEYQNIIDCLNRLKNVIDEDFLIKKNNLIEQEAQSIKIDRNLYQKLDTENKDTIREFLSNKQSIMNTKDKTGNIIIRPGIRAKYDDDIVKIIDVLEDIYIIKKSDDTVLEVPRSSVKLLEGVRNQIKNLTNPKNMINLNKIISELNENQVSIQLLLENLNISSDNDDIMNRPRKEEIVRSFILKKPSKKLVYDDKDFYNYIQKDLLYGNSEIVEISGKSEPQCLAGLSTADKTLPFKIDDFTFFSIQNYHKASQFYNRQDLTTEIRGEYNDFFITFTKDYNGPNSMYNLNISEINDILSNNTFERPYNWNVNYHNRASLSSISLRRAIYNKVIQHTYLKNCLLETGDSKLLERITGNKYRVMNELMEVRYYIRNNILPPYIDFNYNPQIFIDFSEKSREYQQEDNKSLLEVLIELNSYSSRDKYLDEPNPIEKIQLLYRDKEPIRPLNTNLINDLLYSYFGQYIYESFKNNSSSSFEMIIRNNPLFLDNLELVSFVYMYYRLEEKLILKDRMKQNETERQKNIAAQEQQLESIKKIKEGLNTIVRLKKYIPNLWLDGRLDTLYLSIANNLVAQNKYPLNIRNELDKRDKLSTDFIKIKNKPIYEKAAKQLLENVVNLYKLWKPDDNDKAEQISQRSNTDDLLEIKLLSRFLGANITIITNLNTIDISYFDTRHEIPVILPQMTDYISPYVHIVLACIQNDMGIYDYNIYTDLIPDPSKKDNTINYLLDNKTGVLLKELQDGEQEYIGIWNPLDLEIDEDSDMPELGDEEIEMDYISFYTIDDRTYYELTEVRL